MKKNYLKTQITFFYRMGYDCTNVGVPFPPIPFNAKTRETKDTASLSRGKRSWVEETEGIIKNWKDFESFPWKNMQPNFLSANNYFKYIEKILPKGMKITISSNVFELIGEYIFGWVNMFRLLYTDLELVKAVFNKVGKILYDKYKFSISYNCVGAIFHPDDLGYNKGLMMKPSIIREIFLPWLKKYVNLAHKNNKQFWLHSCGNIYILMEELIEDIKIDAFHSFQDKIMPIWKFKKKYGDRIAALGGVDVDKLARLDNTNLRKYIKKILNRCFKGGRFVLGAGNSIPNYVSPKNYLIMLEEAKKWK